MNKDIIIKRSAFSKEHKRLIKLLKSGTKKQLKKEAGKQIKEIKKYSYL